MARTLGGQVYYPHRVQIANAGDKFRMHLDVRTFGPLTVGILAYDTAVCIRTGALEDGYQLNVPSRGTMRMAYGAEHINATPLLAAVHSPQRATSLEGWGAEQQMLAVKIDRTAMDEALERLLGHPLRRPLEMAPALAIDAGGGADVWRIIQILADQLHDAHAAGSGAGVGRSLFETSPFASSLAHSVITGLLYAHEHSYSADLRSPVAPSGPTAIREAVDYIEAHASEPIGVSDVADHIGLSVRALQQGFVKHVQMTPMTYLREIRLARVRHELAASDPTTSSVTTIAASWGFFHVGRFAATYRTAYGESPSDTLRRTS